MNKIGIFAIAIAAIATGTIATFSIADAEKPPTIVENQGVTASLELTLAASQTGEFFTQAFEVLYYGDTLCRIEQFGPAYLLIEFGAETLVQHNNVSCTNDRGANSRLIELDGGADFIFKKGDRLILDRNIGLKWHEVAREI